VFVWASAFGPQKKMQKPKQTKLRRVVCGMGYKQCNGHHTVFYRHSNSQIKILAVYVDDILIRGDDDVEISQL